MREALVRYAEARQIYARIWGRYAQNKLKIATRGKGDMHKICAMYVPYILVGWQNMCKVCARHAQDMCKTCTRGTMVR